MKPVALEAPAIIVIGDRLYHDVARLYEQSNKVILAQDIKSLLLTLTESVGATLLVDLSLFNDDVDHPEVKEIFKQACEQRVIVITGEEDQTKLYSLVEMGARGFCPSSFSDELLMQAISTVAKGEFWIGRKFASYLMSKLFFDRTGTGGRAPDAKPGNSSLTPREDEIAKFVAQGKCDKIIARDLDISPNTVKNHLSNIFKKLQIGDRFQLALIYHGIRLN